MEEAIHLLRDAIDLTHFPARLHWWPSFMAGGSLSFELALGFVNARDDEAPAHFP
jgi:hypothetical protein